MEKEVENGFRWQGKIRDIEWLDLQQRENYGDSFVALQKTSGELKKVYISTKASRIMNKNLNLDYKKGEGEKFEAIKIGIDKKNHLVAFKPVKKYDSSDKKLQKVFNKKGVIASSFVSNKFHELLCDISNKIRNYNNSIRFPAKWDNKINALVFDITDII